MKSIFHHFSSFFLEDEGPTLKSKIYKYMTSISKNVYIDKLHDIVNEHNNTYRSTIEMKPIDAKLSTYITCDEKKNNEKVLKIKVNDHVTISKYKNVFVKVYIPNWSEEVFVIKKVKNTVPWRFVIKDRDREEILGTYHEKELHRPNQTEFRVETDQEKWR